MQPAAPDSSGESFQTPSWVHHAVFYQIFPDRFAKGEGVPKPGNLEDWDAPPTIQGFKGGDLIGVCEHLDHLQDLGITAVYFCPVFQSTANHRYHTYDYFTIDPILGGNEALRRLVDEAHARGIKVVLDGVFNHCSRGFFQFNHILENGGHSPYIDWFSIYGWPLNPYRHGNEPAGYGCWWDDPALPKFNTSNQQVREFLWSVGEYWIRQGIDGWRLDVPNEIDDDEFWREFRRRVKAVNPDAYIVGEIWGDARRWLAGDQFDAVMNYLFTKACLGFLAVDDGIDAGVVSGTGLNSIDHLDAAAFRGTVEWLLQLYPWQATLAQLNLLDSHDTARYLTIVRDDVSALKLAVILQMTFPGAPCVYYGDEIGMAGGATVEDARGGFIWDRSRWNEDLFAAYRECIALRHAHPVLRTGQFAALHAADDVFVFCRWEESEVAVIAVNAGGGQQTVSIELPGGVELQGITLARGDTLPEAGAGTLSNWTLPGRSGTVLTATIAQHDR